MQYDKQYDHLYNSIDVSGNVEPSSTTKTTTTQTDTQSFSPPPVPNTTTTYISRPRFPLVPIIGVLLIIGLIWFIATRFPKDFNSCRTFVGSRILESYPLQCRTFYGATFTQSTFAPLDEVTDFNGDEFFPTPEFNLPTISSPSARPLTDSQTNSDAPATTKGGVAITSPTPTAAAKTSQPQPTQAPATADPIPTQSPSGTAIGSDWVKHRYPDQKIAFYLPKGWSPQTAIRNRTTGVTTIAISPNIVSLSLRSNWDGTNNAQNTAVNYELNGSVPARQIVGDTFTNVYFEKNGYVYTFSCRNDLWATCHIILKNIEL